MNEKFIPEAKKCKTSLTSLEFSMIADDPINSLKNVGEILPKRYDI
jgi:hypothetical protein